MPALATPGNRQIDHSAYGGAACPAALPGHTTKDAQKLRELIEAKNAPLGETDGGKLWCLKALHPSDPAVDIGGLPDQFSGATTCLNLQQVWPIKPDPGASGTYSVDILFNPDAVSFGYARVSDSVGTRYVELVNTQITPGGSLTDYFGGLTNLMNWFERWRLIYAGLTVYQDGPALSNQGSVAVAQYPFEPSVLTAFPAFAAGNNTGTAGQAPGSLYPLALYAASDLPSYEKSQVMPNAYFSESKNGVYLPLRLGPNHQKWHSGKELMHFVASTDETNVVANYPACAWNNNGEQKIFPAYYSDGSNIVWPEGGTSVALATCMSGHPPHPALKSFGWECVGSAANSPIRRAAGNRLMAPQLAEIVGSLCFRNLSVSTGLQLYCRAGVEAQCSLGSPYAPYLKVAPAYDPAAVEMYYKISRELKDAYPSEYNDLGKLWGTIKEAAKAVVPAVTGVLSGVPGPIGAAASFVDKIVKPTGMQLVGVPAAAPRDKPPAAAMEREQESLKRPVVLKVPKTRAVRVAGKVKKIRR